MVYGGETSFPSQVIRLASTVRSHIDSMCLYYGFHGGSEGKESACNAGNPGLISGYGRSPAEGDGNPFEYLFPENPMDRRLAGCSPWDCRVG